MQKFVQPFFARMRASAREVRRISSMTGAAMLAALAVVLDRFTWQVGPMLEIGVSFLAVGVSGFLYGPASSLTSSGIFCGQTETFSSALY